MSQIIIFILGMISCLLLLIAWISWEYTKYKKMHNCDDHKPINTEKEKRRIEIMAETDQIRKRVIELQDEMKKLYEV